MAKLSGKAGQIYVASTLIDDCNAAWVNGTNGTASLETTIKKTGVGSAKVVMGAGITAGNVVMYLGLASTTNFSLFSHALCWARSSGTTAAADLRLCLDKDSGLPTAPESLLDFPVLTANTWKYCHLTNVAGSEIALSTAAFTTGLEMNANAAQLTVYLDNIRAAKTVLGINSWSLDNVTDALETTDFSVAGVRAYVTGGSGWSGTFSGYKDGAPLSMGEIYGVELAESATATQMYLGDIIVTGVSPSAAVDGLVLVTYTFQGTGDLTPSST